MSIHTTKISGIELEKILAGQRQDGKVRVKPEFLGDELMTVLTQIKEHLQDEENASRSNYHLSDCVFLHGLCAAEQMSVLVPSSDTDEIQGTRSYLCDISGMNRHLTVRGVFSVTVDVVFKPVQSGSPSCIVLTIVNALP